MTATVLIVEDSLTIRMDLAEAFEEAGFRPLLSATIAEARAALLDVRPDVVVLDIVLPDGDGIELLRELRASARSLDASILMLSSEAEIHDRIRALETGADDYVGKPYDRSYVVAKARELLRGRRPTADERPRTVLVIDDSETFRQELRMHLEAAGYETVTAASGEDGLRLAADRRPSAVIVDGVLPGIDGATVIRHLRLDAALRSTPCLLLTASEAKDAELRALDAGADAFVRKGDDVEVILAKLAATLRSAATERVAETTSSLGPRKVLAVDDSETYLHELAATLRAEGYDVVLARSGEQALELLAVEPVDCILLDLVMPGLGGTETCRRIKSAPVVRDIPLVIVTATEDRAAMLETLAAGADDYIAKSVEVGVLKARVRAQIRRKQLEDEHRRIREQLLRKELEASEARAARQLAETRAAFTEELELKNQELEAFSYSVSHDLRAPLRTIEGFARILVEDYGATLDPEARQHLERIDGAARRMKALIEDLLQLAQVTRGELRTERCDLAAMARSIGAELAEREPARKVELVIGSELGVDGDPGLLRTVLDNLLGNAWKYTARREHATVELAATKRDGRRVFYVRDNGVGFDGTRAATLFQPFRRLHASSEFEGTGIGLATVQRVIARHGGRVWAESDAGGGATIFFTLGTEN